MNTAMEVTDKKQKKFLTVAPFECAWYKDLRFREAGRGCVAFEAFAHNDVTVVFREHVGGQQYHYKRDSSPHYTVILGSHRNRRLKIEADGKTVVDVEGVALCSSSTFQSYWISIYDGLISIGKGRYPFQNVVFKWLDSNPNCSVQYVGLSSWDRHVGYRNVSVLPLNQNHISLWKQVDCIKYSMDEDDDEEEVRESGDNETWGLENFLENWDLSDVFFIVGEEEKPVPAHKVVLAASGNFGLSAVGEEVIQLQQFSYPTLHAFLQYIYTGKTQMPEFQLNTLKELALQFEVMPLVRQCQELIERFKTNKKLFDSGKSVEISYPTSQSVCCTTFPTGLPVNVSRLKSFFETGEYSDMDIYVEDYGSIARSHKIIISLWSIPFMKMFTNGMSESSSDKVCLREISPEPVKAMLEFMYGGELNSEYALHNGSILLQLLLLSDQFGIIPLQQECCKILLECLAEDSVCPILQVISSVQSCQVIEESCKRKFASHFDYCTTRVEFTMLDETTFRSILQHPNLTVTSEEKVLNAIVIWCLQGKETFTWDAIDDVLQASTPQLVFGERLNALNMLLPCVRFPLMPYDLLKKLEKSTLMEKIPCFASLHRRSSYKELQYISDGDGNGALYFAGTSYGQHHWVNPVLSKRIAISASSPTSRFTDPKVLASRSYQGTSFAGHRIEDGKKCSWWIVDLGEEHQLMCNYYTLRQDGSRAFIRYWTLQGSMDGKTWTNLRVHENDNRICKPGQFASWAVAGQSSLLPFRFFRVMLNGPTTDFADPWKLCICFLELYGYFH
ncbi:hypothetical protein V2J09_023974 [Rumex salicifolius]